RGRMTGRYPFLGAVTQRGGVRFRLWAPAAQRADVVSESGQVIAPMRATGRGYFEADTAAAEPGLLYRYRIDGRAAYPDPASRFQPQGVHGPSMVIDPRRHQWRDGAWRGVAREDLVFYELHVGAFTPEGTFDGARRRLPYLREIGV